MIRFSCWDSLRWSKTRQCGAWPFERSLTRPTFLISWIVENNAASWTGTGSEQLRGFTITIITAHSPGPAWPAHTMSEYGPQSRRQVHQNSGSRMFLSRVKTLSAAARESYWQNSRGNFGEIDIQSSAIWKCACQSADGLSATQNGQGLQRVSAPCWNQTLTGSCLDHELLCSYRSIVKNGLWLAISRRNLATLSRFFESKIFISDCSSQISRQEKTHRILDCKPSDRYIFVILSCCT